MRTPDGSNDPALVGNQPPVARIGVNYVETFIEVAPDTRAVAAVVPPARAITSVALRQFELISESPYSLTSEDVIFTVYAERAGIPQDDWAQARAAYFSVGRACLRSSPLPKAYGWGIHADSEARVALVPLGSPEYERLATADDVVHLAAMRSARG